MALNKLIEKTVAENTVKPVVVEKIFHRPGKPYFVLKLNSPGGEFFKAFNKETGKIQWYLGPDGFCVF